MTDQQITALAATSSAARYPWRADGVAPIGYTKGMALAYARLYAALKAGDKFAAAMAVANTHDAERDALSWYAGIFDEHGMANDVAGSNVLRHDFMLLWGLGMRESSGQYCCGRDQSARNVSADTAEAGLFQMSWNAHEASPLLLDLYNSWHGESLLTVFQEGVRCKPADAENYGIGLGQAFQARCKLSPLFAVWFAALGLRVVRTHWGPIDLRADEVRPEVDELLQQVQLIVDAASEGAPPKPGPDTA
jgi:hypothetical protein